MGRGEREGGREGERERILLREDKDLNTSRFFFTNLSLMTRPDISVTVDWA